MKFNNLLSSTSTAVATLLALSFSLPSYAEAPMAVSPVTAAATGSDEDVTAQLLPVVPQTPETIDKLLRFEEQGEAAFQKHELDKALTKWQDAYGLSKEMRSSEGEGRALTNMCRLYLERGQLVRAKELGENALEVLSNGSDQKALARTRVALAQVYFKLDQPALAGQQLELAMKAFAELGVSDAPEAAKVMYLAANLLAGKDKLIEAMQFYQGAASYYGQAGDLVSEISLRTSIAAMFQELGYLVAGEEEANKAVTAALNTKNPALVVGALATLANCLYNLGEYENARSRYEAVLAIPFKLADPVAIAQFQSGYGSTLAALGEYEQSKIYLENAFKLLKTKANSLTQASLLNILANTEAQLGHYQTAIQHFNQALEMEAISTPKRPKLRITILQNLAATESRFGDNRTAKQNLTTVLPMFKTVNNPVLEGRTYAALAEICLNLKDVAAAESFAKQGIAISEKVHDDASLWRDYTILAQLQLAQVQLGQLQPQVAKETLNSAVSYLRSPQAGNFSSAENLNFPSSREDFAYKLVSILISQKLFDTAYSLSAQLKEDTFIADWKRSQGTVKVADQEIYNDLSKTRARIHAAEVGTSPGGLVKEWRNWMSRFAQLAIENKPLARLIAPLPLTASEVINLAQQKHATILDYLVGPSSTTVFTISSLGKLSAHSIPVGRKQLETQVASLLNPSKEAPKADAAGNIIDTDKRTLQILGSELLPPAVAANLPKNPDETLVVIPDGVLFNVPFAALVEGNGKYLVENHTIALAASPAALIDGANAQKAIGGQNMLVAALGAKIGDKAAEATAIAQAFDTDSVTTINGTQTPIQEFAEKAAGNSYLHLATNLPLPASNPLATELPVPASKEANSPKATTRSLLESNLATDLFVLSGTTINAKDTRGNAVKVLSRGLHYGGARNVMMSLWLEPEDTRSGQLGEFYKESRKGIGNAKSLRKAQLTGVSKNASPRQWAAYQLWGPCF